MQPQSHWENVYSNKAANALSWYQPHASVSLELIRHVTLNRPASLIDVGGGASTLVDDLLGGCRTWGAESEKRPQRGQFLPDLQAHSPAMGQKDGEKWTAAVDLQPAIPKSDSLLDMEFAEVSVLDISEAALNASRRRLRERAARVRWLQGDITTLALPAAAYDIWHDRAVFHFLTDPDQRAAYVAQVRRAVRPAGHVIVATFAPDGPDHCSGLPVVRYAPEALLAQFGAAFELIEHRREEHLTPSGAIQRFVYCHCVMH